MADEALINRIRTLVFASIAFGEGRSFAGVEPLEYDFAIPELVKIVESERKVAVLEAMDEVDRDNQYYPEQPELGTLQVQMTINEIRERYAVQPGNGKNSTPISEQE